MAILARMSRLFSADLNAVLDRLEEPDALLKQAIRDMGDALTTEKTHLAALEHERGTQVTRRSQHETRLTQLDAELDLCFDDGNEGLARKLVRRKLHLQSLSGNIAARLERIDAEMRVVRERVEANESRLADMREQAEIVIEPSGRAIGPGVTECGEPCIGDDEVEAAFLRERQKRRRS